MGRSTDDKLEELRVTELVLVRHAESTWNSEGRIQGASDCPLSEAGLDQASALATHLADERFDVLVSSDLTRAIDTARAIASRLGLPLEIDKRFRERGLGSLEGTYLERDDEDPCVRFDSDNPRYPVTDGESVHDFFARAVQALEGLASRHVGKRILVVTHGGVLGCALKHTLRMPRIAPSRAIMGNGCLSRFIIRDRAWILRTWGEVPQHRNVERARVLGAPRGTS